MLQDFPATMYCLLVFHQLMIYDLQHLNVFFMIKFHYTDTNIYHTTNFPLFHHIKSIRHLQWNDDYISDALFGLHI